MTNTSTKAKGNAARLLVFAAAALVITSAAYYLWPGSETVTDDAQVQQLLTPINARVAGYITSVRFKDFQWVEKGDTLVTIDDMDYRYQMELAEAALLDAEAARGVAISAVATLENGVHISDSRIEETRARLWNAEQNFRRYEALLKKESVTQQQYDQMKSDYLALKAQLVTLEKSSTGSTLTAQEASRRLKVNEAAIKRAGAQLKLARLNVTYTVITAPASGYTGRKAIAPGQLVQAGQQLTSLVDDGQKWITANFKEKQLPGIYMGQKARISIDGVPSAKISGKVMAFASATGAAYSLVPVDNATGNFVKIQQRIPVRIEFDRETDPKIIAQLRSGMNAVITLEE